MKKMARAVMAAACLVLSACATQTIRTEDAKEVQPLPTFSAAVDGSIVVVKRNKSYAGMMCADRIFVNGVAVAALQIGEKVALVLPAGRVILGAERQLLCPGQLRELSVDLRAGEKRVFVVDFTSSGEYIFQETAL